MHAINLMTPQACRRELFRLRQRQWARVLCLASLCLSAITFYRYVDLKLADGAHHELQARYTPIKELASANKKYAKQIASIQQEAEFVLSLSDKGVTLPLLGVLGRAVSKANEQLFLSKIEISRTPGVESNHTAAIGVVDILGVASDANVVKELGKSFQVNAPFTSVSVPVIRELRLNQKVWQEFSLECTY